MFETMHAVLKRQPSQEMKRTSNDGKRGKLRDFWVEQLSIHIHFLMHNNPLNVWQTFVFHTESISSIFLSELSLMQFAPLFEFDSFLSMLLCMVMISKTIYSQISKQK